EAAINGFRTASGTTPASRLRLVISQIPANVSVFAPIFPSEGTSRAQLFSADGNGQGGAGYVGVAGSYQQLSVSGGVATATWVVLSSDSTQLETDTFPLLVQNASAQNLTQIQVAASLAPASTVSVASSTASVP